MNDKELEAILAYFRSILSDRRVTRDLIIDTVQNDTFYGNTLKDFDKNRLIKHLESNFVIEQNRGSVISNDHKPWLNKRKPTINFFYWNRLKNFMNNKGVLPSNVIATLDKDTDDILDLCGDPANDDGSWSMRGMVMGHVQSGKTTNYAALITKAADAGYRVIILLAGITNSLRSQTQVRIDEYFIGRKSVYNAAAQDPLPIVNFGGGIRRDPDFGTTRDRDFSRDAAVTGAAIASLKEPKIFILKKNKAVLENLNIWLNDQSHDEVIEFPLLMIDDEADNASINTSKNPTRSTAINVQIRDLLSKFRRSSYIGYTATPFANIFIEPNSNSAMQQEDLFPRHFIKALEAPTDYCGANRIFSDGGDLKERMLVNIDDYVDILPIKHKKDLVLECLPSSLEEAIRCFVISRALRYIRDQKKSHCTMMINVSRFNDMQNQVKGLVYTYLEQIKDSICVNARNSNPHADADIIKLNQTYSEHFSHLDISFDEVLTILHNASSTIQVTTVNMQGGKLDYEANKEAGLHIIAIGGLALSRGLTLEGLTVTYLLRNVGASDTLMQMARWFGYRRGYEDLCKLFLPFESQKHYEEVTKSINELHSEVEYMQKAGLTPYEFGLKVRQSETGIRITAANKMRSAFSMLLASDYSAKYIQGHTIFNNQDKNLKNIKAVKRLLSTALPRATEHPEVKDYWIDIDGNLVHKLLTELTFPAKIEALSLRSDNSSLISDYVRDRLDSELSKWDLAIACRKTSSGKFKPVTDFLPNKTYHPVVRETANVNPGGFSFTEKGALGDADTVKLGLSDEQISKANEKSIGAGKNKYCSVRQKPLLVIYLVGIDPKIKNVQLLDYCISVVLCLPNSDIEAKEHEYLVNKVFIDSTSNIEDDEDEETNELQQ